MDVTSFTVIGGVVGFVASIAVSIMGYFLRRLVDEFKEAQGRMEKTLATLEGRMDRRLNDMREQLDGKERESLEHQASINRDFALLNDRFVPRRELEAILGGFTVSMDHVKNDIHQQDKKLDKILDRIDRIAGNDPRIHS